MRPYPNNIITIKPVSPVYTNNSDAKKSSRYSTYRLVDNLPYKSLEVRLSRAISTRPSYKGYYYTTTRNETITSIAKRYYDREDYYWILAKANDLKDDKLLIIPKGTTLVIPHYSELQKDGGYFQNTSKSTERQGRSA